MYGEIFWQEKDYIDTKKVVKRFGKMLIYKHWHGGGGNRNSGYSKEIEYLKQNGAVFYPFEGNTQGKRVPAFKYPIFWDKDENEYLLLDKKKLYCSFRTFLSVLNEQNDNSPHRYFSESCQIQAGEIFVDVGAAEGMISLKYIDEVSKVYLVENDERWEKNLQKTFAPYKEKVNMIYKYASNINDDEHITLDKMLANETGDITIKIDVEGAEAKVLEGAEKLLKRKNVKFAVCTYHNDSDADDFKQFFISRGYHVEFSEGYLWVPLFSKKAPYLNKGVLRAWKQ